MHDYWNYGGGYSGWGWLFMLLMMALVVVGVVAGLILIIRNWRPDSQVDTALDILKKRYASGEIDKKEFDKKRQDIGI